MSHEELVSLAQKVYEGQASRAELALYHEACEALQKDPEAWAGMEDELIRMEAASLRNFWDSQKPAQTPVVPLWKKITTVAAAVTAITLGVYFFKGDSGVLKQVQDDVVVNDIAPGKNGATITLANGQVIPLSGTKKGVVVGEALKYDDGSEVLGAKNSVTLTASTSKGQTYEFTLPDGTHVWLNADSKISFPSQFSGKERKILLSGEGYFEVAKDKAHPFVVTSGKERIEVLGTHFNLNNFGDEHPGTVTSLLEGSVKMTDGIESRILKPGERGVSTVKGIMLLRGDAEQDIDWKNGDFIFEQESLAEIMRKVSRWYDVEVIYAPGVDQQQTFSGKVSRKRNISQVIKALQTTQALKFKIEGKQVYLSN